MVAAPWSRTTWDIFGMSFYQLRWLKILLFDWSLMPWKYRCYDCPARNQVELGMN